MSVDAAPPTPPTVDGFGFLRRLLTYLRALRTYPAGHIQIDRAFEGWDGVFRRFLAIRDPLEIATEKDRVFVQGVAVQTDDPVVGRFREGLRQRGIRAVRFRAGCAREAMQAFAEALSTDPRGGTAEILRKLHDRRPLGLDVDELVYHTGAAGPALEEAPAAGGDADFFDTAPSPGAGSEPAGSLLQDPEVQGQIEEARRRLQSKAGPSEPGGMVDALPLLLADIREALIEDGVYSESEVRRVLLGTLRRLGLGERSADLQDWVKTAPDPVAVTLTEGLESLEQLTERDRHEILRNLLSTEGTTAFERVRKEIESFRPEPDFVEVLLEIWIPEAKDNIRQFLGERLREELEAALGRGDAQVAWGAWRWVFLDPAFKGEVGTRLRAALDGIPTDRWTEVAIHGVRPDVREDVRAFCAFIEFQGLPSVASLMELYLRLEDPVLSGLLAKGLAVLGPSVLFLVESLPALVERGRGEPLLRLLGAFDGEEAERFYVRLLRKSSGPERERIYRALANRKDVLGTRLLVHGLQETGAMRRQIIELFGEVGNREAVQHLCNIAGRRKAFHRNYEDRIAAIQALERIGDPAAVPVLSKIESSRVGFWFGEEARVQSWASFALRKIQRKEAP